jgi:hypothetical protein
LYEFGTDGRASNETLAGIYQPQRRPALAPDEEQGMTQGGFIRADYKQVGAIEEWRTIPEAPGYEVSSFGRVCSWLPLRNFAKPPTERRMLKPKIDKDGYLSVVIRNSGNRLHRRVATLVAEAWHGMRPDGLLVRHLDGSKDNNIPSNLMWGTPQDNSDDAKKHGTIIKGGQVNTSRFTPEIVKFIRSSQAGHSVLAREYGVTPSAIWHIRAGRTWQHVV